MEYCGDVMFYYFLWADNIGCYKSLVKDHGTFFYDLILVFCLFVCLFVFCRGGIFCFVLFSFVLFFVLLFCFMFFCFFFLFFLSWFLASFLKKIFIKFHLMENSV